MGCSSRSGTLASLHSSATVSNWLIHECLAIYYCYSCCLILLGLYRPWTARRSNIDTNVEEFDSLVRLQLLIKYSYCTCQSLCSAFLFMCFPGPPLVLYTIVDRWRIGDGVVDCDQLYYNIQLHSRRKILENKPFGYLY